MAVTVETHNTGDSISRSELVAVIEHVLNDRPGDWRVSILGSRASDNWDMKVEGPKGFERSYTLMGSRGELRPEAVHKLLLQLLPSKTSRGQ